MIWIVAADLADARQLAGFHGLRSWEMLDSPGAAECISSLDQVIYTAQARRNPLYREIENVLSERLGG